nr:immunoglobulin heavy chain junction region [Mus musculus]
CARGTYDYEGPYAMDYW